MNKRRAALAAAIGLTLAGVGLVWAQTAARPRPATVTLTPSRSDMAALAAARRDPVAARSRTLLQRSEVQPDVLAAIDVSEVPVLGPAEPGLLRASRVFISDDQYTLSLERPGQVIEVHGTYRAFAAPPEAAWPPRRAAPRPQLSAARAPAAPAASPALARAGLTNVSVERTEYGVDVSFSRFGAAYSLTLVCDDPAGDARCSDAAAVQMAANLQLLGGGPGR